VGAIDAAALGAFLK